MSIFDKWDNSIDTDGLAKDVAEAAKNRGGDYEEVPKGIYEVTVDKLELKESKKGDPMVSAWFKIMSGDHKGQLIFMNQVITRGFQIHIVNEFLRSLETGKTVEFHNYGQYNELIMDIFEAMGGAGIILDYSETKKGFPTFKVTEVFELEPEF